MTRDWPTAAELKDPRATDPDRYCRVLESIAERRRVVPEVREQTAPTGERSGRDALVDHLRQAFRLTEGQTRQLGYIRRGAIYACVMLRADMLVSRFRWHWTFGSRDFLSRDSHPGGMSVARPRRRNFPPEEKVRIVREHLMDGRPVSAVGEEFGVRPSQLYQWRAQLFEQGAAAFRRQQEPELARLRRRVEELRERLARKDRVIEEFSEEYVAARKGDEAM